MYQSDPSNDNQENLRNAKAKLQQAYDAVTEDELAEMINRVQTANSICKQSESWELVNKSQGGKQQNEVS